MWITIAEGCASNAKRRVMLGFFLLESEAAASLHRQAGNMRKYNTLFRLHFVEINLFQLALPI